MGEEERSRTVVGAILIVLGVGLLAMRVWDGLDGSIFLFLIGSAFVVGYLVTRHYALLIPGGILLGLAAIDAESLAGFGDLGAIGLGLGFIFIYVVALIYQGNSHWWPLIPGGIMLIAGLSQGNEALEQVLSVGWPLILIVIGLALLVGAFGLINRGNRETTPPPQE